jgi:hypothetical protein
MSENTLSPAIPESPGNNPLPPFIKGEFLNMTNEEK